MKIRKLLPYLLIIASSASIFAAPSEINYQGVLTDQQGNPINGIRAMQIKIYDAPTGGTLLYSEDLGNVPVQDGIYSFAFGANGTSNALTTETIAIANGTVSTFQKVLAAPTVVAGSVTVTDGTYTWDQTNGSTNENDFSVAYSPNLRRVTVTYYSGAPAAGKTISASFRSPNSGIASSIADISNAWAEVSIGGTAQNPRQKVLAVPFSNFSGTANQLIKRTGSIPITEITWNNGIGAVQQTLYVESPGKYTAEKDLCSAGIPFGAEITNILIDVFDTSTYKSSYGSDGWTGGNIIVKLFSIDQSGLKKDVATGESGREFNAGEKKIIITPTSKVCLDGSVNYKVSVWVEGGGQYYNITGLNGSLKLNSIRINFSY
jgi:hypothetical protein